MDLQPIRWVVPDFLPQGLTILGGKPKVGKSWFVLNLVLAIAQGTRLFNRYQCEQGTSLYMALEDTPEGMKERQTLMLHDAPKPDSAYFGYDMPRIGATPDGIDSLEEWLSRYPDTKVIALDTFAKIRRPKRGRVDDYDKAYDDLGPLQELAGTHGISIIVCHHQRKQEAEDVFDTLHGSQGVFGCADAVWMLQRPNRRSDERTLTIDGRRYRDVINATIHFDKDCCNWSWVGDAQAIQVSRERREILDILIQDGGAMTTKELEQATGKEYHAVYRLLGKLVESGHVIKVGKKYCAS